MPDMIFDFEEFRCELQHFVVRIDVIPLDDGTGVIGVDNAEAAIIYHNVGEQVYALVVHLVPPPCTKWLWAPENQAKLAYSFYLPAFISFPPDSDDSDEGIPA